MPSLAQRFTQLPAAVHKPSNFGTMPSLALRLTQLPTVNYRTWAARYNTWLLIKLTTRGVVFSVSFSCLQERELEVVTLKAQLSEFRQPALALAGGPTTWDSDTAQAAEPLRGSSSFSNASWANNWNSGVIRSADGGTAVLEAQPQALSVLQSQLSAATVRCEASAKCV